MMLEKLLSAIFQIRTFDKRRDDDFVDRISRLYSPGLLVLFTIVVSVKQYVGAPIDCWCPAQFTQSHTDYTNKICWVNSTYYVSMDDTLPLANQRRRFISYYQWVPFILMSQAMFFFWPCLFWRYGEIITLSIKEDNKNDDIDDGTWFLSRRVGLNIPGILETSKSCQKALYPEARDTSLRYIVVQIDGYLRRQRRTPSSRRARAGAGIDDSCCACARRSFTHSCCWFFPRFSGNYLCFAYLFVKMIYACNAIVQLFALDSFLGMDRSYYWYGWTVLKQVLHGVETVTSDRFPRVTICDFYIRQQMNIHTYTVQCVLPINLFNEKIFLFVWFWLIAVAFVTILSIFHWFTRIVLLSAQSHFVSAQLRAVDRGERRDPKVIRRFTCDYLCRDGMLVTRLIANNCGELVAAEVLCGLWQNYGPDTRSGMRESGRLCAAGGVGGGSDEEYNGSRAGGNSDQQTTRKRAPRFLTSGTRGLFSRLGSGHTPAAAAETTISSNVCHTADTIGYCYARNNEIV